MESSYNQSMPLLEMEGISMAPWLLKGDVLWVDDSVSKGDVRVGDVVILRRVGSGEAIAHRVVQLPMVTKGDRNFQLDSFDEAPQFEGVVRKIHRNGRWRPLRFGKLKALISRSRLYPGQRIPYWMGRTSLKKLLNR